MTVGLGLVVGLLAGATLTMSGSAVAVTMVTKRSKGRLL